MQRSGITISKAINKIKVLKGSFYKHRYHIRQISSARDLKNVLRYNFGNGIKHKRTRSIVDPFNSLMAENKLAILYPKEVGRIWADIQQRPLWRDLYQELLRTLSSGEIF